MLRDVRPDPVLLFRYSALTGNGHRIHYDLDYVTRVEGYPGLVVHGPLQATWLAELAQHAAGGAPRRSVFLPRPPPGVPRSQADPDRNPLRQRRGVESRDETGAVCMTAEASLA